MIATLVLSAGFAALAMGWIAVLRHGAARTVHGWFAIANGAFLAFNALTGDRMWACIASGACAYSAWTWWRSGGGDGTKRRLKAWARRFRGVRRTAPALGGGA